MADNQPKESHYYICPKCLKLSKIEGAPRKCLCSPCLDKLKKIENDLKQCSAKELYQEIILVALIPRQCEWRCGGKEYIHKGLEFCPSCNKYLYTPNIFSLRKKDTNQRIEINQYPIGKNMGQWDHLADIPKAMFEFQKIGWIIIFEILEPFSGQNMYFAWLPPEKI